MIAVMWVGEIKHVWLCVRLKLDCSGDCNECRDEGCGLHLDEGYLLLMVTSFCVFLFQEGNFAVTIDSKYRTM